MPTRKDRGTHIRHNEKCLLWQWHVRCMTEYARCCCFGEFGHGLWQGLISETRDSEDAAPQD